MLARVGSLVRISFLGFTRALIEATSSDSLDALWSKDALLVSFWLDKLPKDGFLKSHHFFTRADYEGHQPSSIFFSPFLLISFVDNFLEIEEKRVLP